MLGGGTEALLGQNLGTIDPVEGMLVPLVEDNSQQEVSPGQADNPSPEKPPPSALESPRSFTPLALRQTPRHLNSLRQVLSATETTRLANAAPFRLLPHPTNTTNGSFPPPPSSNFGTCSSHSDKEVDPNTPEKVPRTPSERKRKRKADDSGGVVAIVPGGKGPRTADNKKINDYFNKHAGTSPIRHGGSKSPSPQQGYPMFPPSPQQTLLPSPVTPVTSVPPEFSSLMHLPRPLPVMASKLVQTELTCQRIQEFETQASSDLELRNNKIDELNRTTEELRHQLTAQQKVIDQHKLHINKCIDVVKKLLKEKSNIEKKEARQKCMQNRLRLGQFVTQRVGATFQENWTDGYAFQELARRQEEITSEREEIDRQKKMLLKKRPSNSETGRKRNTGQQSQGSTTTTAILHNGTDATFLKPDPVPGFSWQEYYEADEILKLRQSALKKEDADLQLEMEKLERERNLHIRELKRIHNEDQSRFNNHPVLNERYLLLMLLGKGGFSEVHKAFDLKEQRYVACKVHQLNKDWKEDKKANYIK
uniref:Tousled-like kinase n=1 Tax=Timema bartmani TaxID=61472 RepID=A0A7R9F359_9NEOP|nr:unnamed protein product [Timema bartmani]